MIAADRELLDIYLLGTPVDQLLQEVTCGELEVEGAKVRIPSDRFDALNGRLEIFWGAHDENQGGVKRFLAHRCSPEFIKTIRLQQRPWFLESLRVGSYFYAVPDVEVMNKFHQLGILPEQESLRHVAAIRELAATTPDAGYLNRSIVSFMTKHEIDETTAYVRAELLSHFDSCISSWRDNWDPREDPENHFYELTSALQTFESALSDDEEAIMWIVTAKLQLDSAADEMRKEMQGEPDFDYGAYSRPGLTSQSEERSIFDDVDE